MTTMAHTWKPSEAQINLLRTVFAERVADSEPNREQFWRNITSNVSNRQSFQTALDALKARPRVKCPAPACTQASNHEGPHTVVARPKAPEKRTDIATEPGLYRDPSDGTLYKLGKASSPWATPSLSVYSLKATVRRLTPEGQMVRKGTWKRLDAYQTRQMLAVSPRVQGPRLLAAWLMTEEDKNTWAVGFCLFCSKPLIDAISVFNSIGPKCATDRGIERAVPPEHLVRQIEQTVLDK